MKLTQKRTCTGCRAAYSGCELGYKISRVEKLGGLLILRKPEEPCPKPKTIDDLFFAREHLMRREVRL